MGAKGGLVHRGGDRRVRLPAATRLYSKKEKLFDSCSNLGGGKTM